MIAVRPKKKNIESLNLTLKVIIFRLYDVESLFYELPPFNLPTGKYDYNEINQTKYLS